MWAKEMPALIAMAYADVYPGRAPPIVNITVESIGDSSGDLVYIPYYSAQHTLMRLGLSSNELVDMTGGSRSSNFYYVDESVIGIAESIPAGSISFAGMALSGYNRFVYGHSAYTQIDDYTARGLRRLASEAGIDTNADRAVIVDSVAAYIISSGRYTFSPYVIPEDEDFALYFLENSRQGYCIHFTTAATLMLRSLYIPARFTSGFVFTVGQDSVNQALDITDRNAHTWVEVYYDDIGWLPLEVTPPGSGTGIPDGRAHAARSGSYAGSSDFHEDDPFDEWWLEQQALNEANQGQGTDTAPDVQEQSGLAANWRGMLIVVCIIAVIAGLIQRRKMALRSRDWRFSQPDTNAAAIDAWRYAYRLDRWRKPPKTVEDAAMKARFSTHRISEEERTEVVEYALKVSDIVCKYHNVFWRLWHRYILAVC